MGVPKGHRAHYPPVHNGYLFRETSTSVSLPILSPLSSHPSSLTPPFRPFLSDLFLGYWNDPIVFMQECGIFLL